MSDPVTALEQQSTALIADVQAMAVTDPESYARLGAYLVTIAGYIKRVGEVFDPICAAADKAHKVACLQRDRLLTPARDAKRLAGAEMAAWDQAEKNRRLVAEALAQRERERQEREAREQAATEQRRLLAAAEDRRLAEAAAMEARGDTAAAVRLLEAPIPVPIVAPAPVFMPAPMAPPPPKVEGVSYRDNWEFVIEDALLLPREYTMPDEKKIGGVVRAMRGATNIPGVRAFARRVTSTKAPA